MQHKNLVHMYESVVDKEHSPPQKKNCELFPVVNFRVPSNIPSFESHHLLQIHPRMTKLCCMEA